MEGPGLPKWPVRARRCLSKETGWDPVFDPSSFPAVGFSEQPFLGAAVELLTLKHAEAFALRVETA